MRDRVSYESLSCRESDSDVRPNQWRRVGPPAHGSIDRRHLRGDRLGAGSLVYHEVRGPANRHDVLERFVPALGRNLHHQLFAQPGRSPVY